MNPLELHLIAVPAKIDFQLRFLSIDDNIIDFVNKSDYYSGNDFYIELFKYMPYCKTKYNSAQIRFIQKMMDMTDDEFAKSQFTSAKAIRKIKQVLPSHKVDLNWISEKHLRETVYHTYYKKYNTKEFDFKDLYCNILHIQSFLSEPRVNDYQSNIITFDMNYVSPDNRFKYFYQD